VQAHRIRISVESASELYRPSDRRLSAKWLPTFADRGCHVDWLSEPRGLLVFSRSPGWSKGNVPNRADKPFLLNPAIDGAQLHSAWKQQASQAASQGSPSNRLVMLRFSYGWPSPQSQLVTGHWLLLLRSFAVYKTRYACWNFITQAPLST
jgi:hypothetical protein